MGILSIVIQVLLGLGFIMFGVMKLGSKQMVDEFDRLELPQWFRVVTGLVEITAAIVILIGIWNGLFAALGALLIAFTMIGAILTHIKIKDPAQRVMMPVILLIMGIIVLSLNVSHIGV
ncbi:DoxX family protein [Chengkuizengella axinellae]|uniref:DoxX family protein n=1 Tax=Chengkuizengella axinellae TaxID=3064388 RepID=A0ABT9J533_9BACL|nr:DoxX family protein [Chengkuizengella sp. 2205SS18-9]MDP5276583.1 DoxX family protein [Chengkuizengella sp. 2205SS18-9]